MKFNLQSVRQKLTSMVFQSGGPSTRWLFLTPGERRYWTKVGDGSSSSVVMAPLLWIGRNFPEAPPALWTKTDVSGEEERVTGKGQHGGDHMLLELIARPNDFYTGSLLWMATLTDWHLTGNAYWLKLRDTGKRPIQLWWTYSALLTPVGDEKNFITHYEYRPGADMIEIPSEDVVHFRYGIDPQNPRLGKSPLSSLLHEVFTDTEAGDFVAALLRNMGVPGVVVAPKGDVLPGAGDVQATKDYFKEAFTGERRGEPIVMSGPTSVSQFGFSPQQMNLREIRRIPEERVTAVLGIPAIVCGLGAGLDRSTYANYAEAREAAYQDNIIPSQRLLAEDIHYQLLPDFEPETFWSYRFGFDHSGVRVLQEDRNKLAERLNVGVVGGWVRVAEARRAMDLEVDETDEVYLRSSTVIEVTAGEAMVAPVQPLLSPGNASEQPALPPGESESPTQQQSQSNGHGSKATGIKLVRRSRLSRYLHPAMIRDLHSLSIQFANELEVDFNSFGALCAESYLRLESSAPVRVSSQGGTLVKEPLDAETLTRMVVNDVKGEMQKILDKRFKAAALRTLTRTVKTINMMTGIGVGVSEQAQQDILNNAGKRLGLVDISGQARTSIFNAINVGNQEGAGPIVIARSIRSDVPFGPFVNAGSGYRSQLIARTETNWAQNVASLSAYRESDGIVSHVEAMDGTGDPECAERDGQEYSFDEADAQMGDEHPNGTLAFAPVVGADFTGDVNTPDMAAPTDLPDGVADIIACPVSLPKSYNGVELKKAVLLSQDCVTDPNQLIDFQDKAFKSPDELDPEHKRVTKNYVGSKYDAYNRAIAGKKTASDGKVLTDKIFNDARTLSDLIQNEFTTKKDLKVFRGFKYNFPRLKIGDEFKAPGFVSTSLNQMVSEEFSEVSKMMEIDIPKGSHALPVTKLVDTPVSNHEAEVLLLDHAKFVVKEVRTADQVRAGLPKYLLEYVGQYADKSIAPDKLVEDTVRSRFVWEADEVIVEE